MNNNFTPITQENQELINQAVMCLFDVQDITLGGQKEGFLLRYHGALKGDSETAFALLSSQLKPLGLMALFRIENEVQTILILPDLPPAKPARPWLNLVLFVLTLLSVLFVGAIFNATEDPFIAQMTIAEWAKFILNGWPFGVSMLLILGAHEFGHYFVGRHHGANVSLPFFIPLPFSSLGTMGAFINMKSVPKNKKALFDIGIAGPLAGLVFAIPILFIGLRLSQLAPIEASLPEGMAFQIEGNSLLYLIIKYIIFGKWLPEPTSFGNLPPIIYWARYFFTGHPLPLGGLDVMIHPAAWAGWAGLLVTSLNLLPAGQLDGGHIFSTLFGKKTSMKILPFIIVLLVGLGFAWNGWWLWAAILFLLGRRNAEVLDDITPLDAKRKVLGVVMLIVFVLVFIPVPLVIVSG